MDMHTNNSLSMMEGKVGPSNCESKTLDDAVEKLLQDCTQAEEPVGKNDGIHVYKNTWERVDLAGAASEAKPQYDTNCTSTKLNLTHLALIRGKPGRHSKDLNAKKKNAAKETAPSEHAPVVISYHVLITNVDDTTPRAFSIPKILLMIAATPQFSPLPTL
ncbi:hypothetical protein PV326_010660 [Microctonus aethiopoides]|nr:hypothetical protein PV326_010660 [Microctonus aethiopoides]